MACCWDLDRFGRALVVLGVTLVGWMALVAGEVRAAPPSGRVFTVAGDHGEDGPVRFGRPATDSALGLATIVLGLPRGGFLLDDTDHQRVVQVDPAGVLRAFAGNGLSGSGGDRGPAVRARFWAPSGLALRPDGSVVILDEVDGTARVVAPDGRIRLLHDFGTVNADYRFAVAALPDNSVLVVNADADRVVRITADGRMRVWWQSHGSGPWPSAVAVDGDGEVYLAVHGGGVPDALLVGGLVGPLSTLLSPFPAFGAALTGLPDGGVLAALGGAEPYGGVGGTALNPKPEVWRVAPDATVSVLAGTAAAPDGFDGDGESPVALALRPLDASPSADGGLLIAGDYGVRYLAPEHPRLLAAAITRPTLTSPRRPRISFALTLPAAVEIAVSRRGRRVADVRMHAAAGDTLLELPRALPAGGYTVNLVALDRSGRTATDRQVVFLGGRMEVEMAARAVSRAITDLARGRGELSAIVVRPQACRRMSLARVDCAYAGRHCHYSIAVTLHSDGLPYLRRYVAGHGRRCVLQHRPRWQYGIRVARPL